MSTRELDKKKHTLSIIPYFCIIHLKINEMKIRNILILLIITFNLTLFSQTTESKSVTRMMSLGENVGIKTKMPFANENDLIKLLSQWMKEKSAENIKAPKGSNEFIYNNIYINGYSGKIKIYNTFLQEGKDVAWTSYYFNESNTNITNLDSLNEYVTQFYKKHMTMLYEDSIKEANYTFDKLDGTLKKETKKRYEAEKDIAESKRNIEESEKEIDIAKKNILNRQTGLDMLKLNVEVAEKALKEHKKTEKAVDDAEDEYDKNKDKLKSLKKNLEQLKKSPEANANLISAQTQDIEALETTVKEKEAKYESLKSIYKSKYKELDKILDKEKDLLHDAEKDIKSNNKTETKGGNLIEKEKKKITENEAVISKFETETKVTLQKEIDDQIKFIEKLKERSLIYK